MAIALGQLTPVELGFGESAISLAATGGSWTVNSGRRAAHGVGLRVPFDSIETNCTMSMTVDFFVYYDADLATALGLINSEAATALTTCWLITGTTKISGKMSALSLKCSLEEELSGSITIEGDTLSTEAAPTAPTAGDLFDPSTIAFSNLGTAVKASTFDLSVTNAITPRRYMTAVRTPAALAEGKQVITFSMNMLEIPSVPSDITAAGITVAAPTVAITDTNDSAKTLTITFANALPTSQSGTLNVDDLLEHGIEYGAETVSFGVA